jgi:hemerythrin superfamily protein
MAKKNAKSGKSSKPKNSSEGMDAIELLEADHRKVEKLFKEFEKAEEPDEKEQIVKQVIMELKVHTKIEEEIFYPQIEEAIKEGEELMNEAREEHHVVDLVIAELENMSPDDERYDAKFTVMMENVQHHIEEEEEEIFPKVEKSSLDLEQIGQEMFERKTELMAEEGMEEEREAA